MPLTALVLFALVIIGATVGGAFTVIAAVPLVAVAVCVPFTAVFVFVTTT
jgi:hypothetical protein